MTSLCKGALTSGNSENNYKRMRPDGEDKVTDKKYMTPSELYGVSIYSADYEEIEIEVRKAASSGDFNTVRMCFLAIGNATIRFGNLDRAILDFLFSCSKSFTGEELDYIASGFYDMYGDITVRLSKDELLAVKEDSKKVFGSVLDYTDMRP